MNNKYLISWHDSSKNTGGTKAKDDVEFFLRNQGYKIIDTPHNKYLKMLYVIFVLPFVCLKIRRGVIYVQFPTGIPFQMKMIIFFIKHFSGAELAYIIHDIETLRIWNDGNDHPESEQTEMSFLKEADGIVSLNHKMTDWLIEKGIKAPITDMKIWDYNNPKPLTDSREYKKSIVFAGNLGKSTFLKKWDLETPIDVYGPNAADKYPSNVSYKGVLAAEELPGALVQSFGLVWDGNSMDTCTGNYGSYLRINDPHKVSLYLSSGLPIIIWSEAALADIVRDEKLGITVDSLKDVDRALSEVKVDDYQKMCSNVQNIAKLMRKGYFLTNATDELNKLMNRQEY